MPQNDAIDESFLQKANRGDQLYDYEVIARKLLSEDALAEVKQNDGSYNRYVRHVQVLLAKTGHEPTGTFFGDARGEFGDYTRDAINEVLAAHNLPHIKYADELTKGHMAVLIDDAMKADGFSKEERGRLMARMYKGFAVSQANADDRLKDLAAQSGVENQGFAVTHSTSVGAPLAPAASQDPGPHRG